MKKFLIIVVLYNKYPQESSTIKCLSRLSATMKDNLKTIVWNNSPQDFDSEHRAELFTLLDGIEVCYKYNDGENIPLSVIYNRTIKEYLDTEFLVIMDDDSVFDESMFEKAIESIDNNPDIDLFLPIVYNGNDIVSPAYMRVFKGHYFKEVNPGIMCSKHITAINSGMIIRSKYLKNTFEGYDERIKFYFTDNDFMSRYDSSHDKLFVLDYKMKHTLDFYKKGESYDKKKRRFRELRRSFLVLMKRQGYAAYILTQLYLFIYSVKFAIIHKDIRYIFVF